ncbi:4Fe-4S dicluster domain-containing protein [Clostridium chromiireducens]|uniref:4Fe-4S dicluster domain-containing protein n=1 Tax=Clostridium chromiireducens TaxID=225345 RepID=A0A964RSM6_9CLOT|nr:4Fe-4S dicluster domain-containing protein [Clostridium chromiireducens]MVX67032.1 4Fe-4S dicluster domain-containing protein [Clostridium chromiireducens]
MENYNSFIVGDANKCVGCKACEIACFKAHNEAVTVGNIETPIISRIHVIKEKDFTVPVQCRHCENAPCAKVCPINAIKNEDNAIIIDEEICIGCKACAVACPFGAIEMGTKYKAGRPVMQNVQKELFEEALEEKETKVAYKCDLCKEQGEPACVKACPKDALKLFDVVEEKRIRNIRAVSNLNL